MTSDSDRSPERCHQRHQDAELDALAGLVEGEHASADRGEDHARGDGQDHAAEQALDGLVGAGVGQRARSRAAADEQGADVIGDGGDHGGQEERHPVAARLVEEQPANEPNNPIQPIPSSVTPMFGTGWSAAARTRYHRKHTATDRTMTTGSACLAVVVGGDPRSPGSTPPLTGSNASCPALLAA